MRNLLIILFFLPWLQASSQLARIDDLNLSSFTYREKQQADEFGLIRPEYLKNPDLGIRPFNGPPCSDCVELIDRREASTRYFVKKGSRGAHFFRQSSYGAINYQDEQGWWREINYRLEQDPAAPGIFTANHQPTPVNIDMNRKAASILALGRKLYFNEHLALYHESPQGVITAFGDPDWNHYTAGDDGMRIRDFYPGIDVVFSVRQGQLETSFILNKPLHLPDGRLVMQQDLELPAGMQFQRAPTESNDDLFVVNEERLPYFTFQKSHAYDNHAVPNRLGLTAELKNNSSYLVYTPVNWLNDPATNYPVVIDPVVTTNNLLPVASIAGTKYSAVCWTNGCDYNLSVPTPANATVTNIFASFEYIAFGSCFGEDGGFSIDFGACHFPSFVPGVITCPLPATPYNCGIVSTPATPDLQGCLPPPQCAPQNLDFILHFYRCNNDLNASCAANCVAAAQPWIMTIEGHTLEMSYVSPVQQICAGDTVNVVTVGNYGVPPYAYNWNPSGSVNDTVPVHPAANTTYTVTITDACGTTATGSAQVNVGSTTNPGFTLSPFPACVNQSITLTGNGAASAANYNWIVPGSNAPGGIVNATKAPAIQYSLPGNYSITLRYGTGSCTADSTVTITINSLAAPNVSLTTVPVGAICPGDTMHFFATPSNGGSAPQYDWYVDGLQVQTGPVDSLAYVNLINGSLVQVIMHSNSACVTTTVDTASIFVNISGTLTPSVTITPDTTVCSGSAVTFTASPLDGGPAPSYQWSINGAPVAGATTATYTRNIVAPDTVVSVVMTTSLSCVTAPTANDATIIHLLSASTPVVAITASPNGAVCASDSIRFTAHATYGGAAPGFQFFVNGVASGAVTPDSTFTLHNPGNGDSVSVRMTSNYSCVTASTASTFSLVAVTPSVAPVVSLNATPSASICQGDMVTFTASASGAGANPAFAWYVNGVLQADVDSVFSSSTLSNAAVVTAIVTSSLTCASVPRDTASLTMTVSNSLNPTITIQPASNALCSGDPVLFTSTVTNGGSAPVIQWTQNGANIGLNNDSVTLNPANGDVIQATLTSNAGCVSSTVVQSNTYVASLTPYTTPSVSIAVSPNDTICIGEAVSVQATVLNGGVSPTYQWYVNGVLSGSTTDVLTGNTFQQGDVISLIMNSSAACVTQASDTSNLIRMVLRPPLAVNVNGLGSQCPGVPVTLTALATGGDGGPYSYTWSGFSQDTSTIVIRPGQTAWYHVSVLDRCGSPPAEDSVFIPVLAGPRSQFAYEPTEPSSFNNVVTFADHSVNAVSWTWIFNDSDTIVSRNPVYTFASPGTYPVTLITRSSNGCTDTVTYHIEVREDIAMYFPNAFTPNNDPEHKNELWSPMGLSLGNFEFTIWDRWGEKIFTGSWDKPWDGSVNGSSTPAHDGVYVYQVTLHDKENDGQVITGRVMLIR